MAENINESAGQAAAPDPDVDAIPSLTAIAPAYDSIDDMRFRSGEYEALADAEAKTGTRLERICERCKRQGKAKRVK